MSNLESLFNAQPTAGKTSPIIRFDWKTQSVRFRPLVEFTKFKGPLVRHYIENVGYVECNQRPYRRKDGTYGLWGDCTFCEERKALREKLKAVAIADGRTELNKDEAKQASALHKRVIELIAPVEAEVKEKKKVVKELAAGALSFKVSDLFFPQVTQQYKVLSQIFETKETMLEHWFVLTGNGTIMLDGEVSEESALKNDELLADIDLSYFDAQTKTYEVGLAKYQGVATAAAEAENVEEIIEEDEEPVF